MRRFTLECVGTVPMLMHAIDEESLRPEKQSEATKPDSTILPDGTLKWWKYAYFDEKIGCYIPTENIYKMAQAAGAKVVYKSRETMSSICAAFVFAEPSRIQLLEDGKPVLRRDDLKPFQKACKSQPSKRDSGRVLRIRPIFYNWSFVCDLVVTSDDIPEDRIRKVLDVAGMRMGLGDWRPLFGRFIADLKLKKE